MRKKKILKWIIIIVICTGLGVALIITGLQMYGRYQMGKIPDMSFEEMLEYTTEGSEGAVITVGIIKNGQSAYTVYGENGQVLPDVPHTYEIGSLTKTFTAAMVERAIQEGRVDINAGIDQCIPLPEDKSYPTVRELLTHTSGYASYYSERPMIANFLKGRNDFYSVSKDMVLKKAAVLNMDSGPYPFNYSNFGYALLGLLLETVYDQDYSVLVNQYVQKDLGLADTKISDQSGDLGGYWEWQPGDAYIPAGALTSNIEDMLSYAQMQLDEEGGFKHCHENLEQINASTEEYRKMGIYMDEIGMAWIIDRENGVIWHNGGTSNFNSYLGFNPENGTAVVILSNRAPGYRIPATVMGAKVLKALNE